MMKPGFWKICLNMSPAGTPAATRSVLGNFVPARSTRIETEGSSSRPNFTRQSRPAPSMARPARPPTIMPNGHQACSTLRRWTLLPG